MIGLAANDADHPGLEIKLEHWRFCATHVNRKRVLSLLICLDVIEFVLLSVFTRIEATYLKFWAKPKRTRTQNVRRSKTS